MFRLTYRDVSIALLPWVWIHRALHSSCRTPLVLLFWFPFPLEFLFLLFSLLVCQTSASCLGACSAGRKTAEVFSCFWSSGLPQLVSLLLLLIYFPVSDVPSPPRLCSARPPLCVCLYFPATPPPPPPPRAQCCHTQPQLAPLKLILSLFLYAGSAFSYSASLLLSLLPVYGWKLCLSWAMVKARSPKNDIKQFDWVWFCSCLIKA